MSITSDELVRRAAEYDPALAADFQAFAKSREYGLVFEHNRPEAMRLYGKPIVKGDTVHRLPARGEREKPENREEWKVVKVADGLATLMKPDDADTSIEEPAENIVAVAAYDEPIYAGLKETGRVERGGDKPYHVVIKGENYHALEALLFAYAGKVDCIYIDPPYNSGARDWKYNNDYVDGTDQYRHSKWLAFVERRLKLAKQLMNPSNSVLLCTIDEKEYLRLGLLIEQIFCDSAIQMVTTVINPKGSRRDNEFSRCDEYIYIVRMGDASVKPIGKSMLREKKTASLRWKGTLRSASNHGRRTDRPNLFYPLYFSSENGRFIRAGQPLDINENRESIQPQSGETIVWPIGADGRELTWELQTATFIRNQAKGYVRFGPWDGSSRVPYHLTRGQIEKVENGELVPEGRDEDGALVFGETDRDEKPLNVWHEKSHSASEYGTGVLRKLLPGRTFPFPKSLYAVEDTLKFFVSNKPDALILDFFAGSGTTANAVMRLNHLDGGTRRSISITNNELSDDEAKRLTGEGKRQGDEEWEELGICEYITKPRISAAINGKTPDGEAISGNYKFIDEFPMADGFEENAIFFDLTYQDPIQVDLDQAFEEIAPLLWLRAGCKGSIIETQGDRTYAIADSYAILFDYASAKEFVEAVEARTDIETIYVVTDDERRYQSINQTLNGRDVVQLYESYLRNFEIAAEGALR